MSTGTGTPTSHSSSQPTFPPCFFSSDGTMVSLAQREKVPSDEDSVNFTVKDIKGTIKELEGRGVVFNDYDTERLKTVDHISEYKGFQAAWFKDSEGNTLQINQSPEQA